VGLCGPQVDLRKKARAPEVFAFGQWERLDQASTL
jgi:hypothetical protein